ASGRFLATLTDAGIKCVSLVHELPGILKSYALGEHAKTISEYAETVVFPASAVERGFAEFAIVPKEKVRIRPQGLYKRNRLRHDQLSTRRKTLRDHLSLSPNAVIILGVGYADHRKGVDLFVEAGLVAAARRPELNFVWVGSQAREMSGHINGLLKN